jgi:hypothetical protein
MSYPPPPHEPHVPGSGGGFGPPPEDFGPPGQAGPPAGGYGCPGPPLGYAPGGPGMPGGPGPYPPPPVGGGGNGPKVAAIVIAAVLTAALGVGGVLLLGGGGDKDGEAAATPSDTSTTTGIPGLDLPTDDPARSGGLSQSPGPGELVPFVVLDPGSCFDHPALSSSVVKVEKRSCHSPHNGEVITNRKLTGGYGTEQEIRDEVLALCKKDAEDRVRKIPQDGTLYYFYAIYPSLSTYQAQGEDTVSCSLTLSNDRDGTKLTRPLPGS